MHLGNGVPVVGLTLTKGQDLMYTVTIPKGATYGEVGLFNGTGNADLYVKYGSAPTMSSYDCRPHLPRNHELCTMSRPQPGTYYIMVHGSSPVSGLTLRALWVQPAAPAPAPTPPPATQLRNGVPVVGLKLSSGQDQLYAITIPNGATYSEVGLFNGTGDADLYVKYGSVPTMSSYDCRPRLAGNNERCSVSNPAAGTYYILVHGYRQVSGLTLRGLWEQK